MAAAIERRLTAGPRDAASLAARSTGFDTIIAVGGDGLIHEVANGLMSLPHDDRPALAVIPIGSNNDFALVSKIFSILNLLISSITF